MMKYRKSVIATTFFGLIIGWYVIDRNVNAEPQPQQVVPATKVQPIMHRKLDAAKDILEGLTLEDHDKVVRAASQLKSLSLEAGWNVIQTERYQFESEELRRNCDSVIDAAKKKDTGRVAMGYIAMTVRCVECHDYMRHRQRGVVKD